MSDKQAWIIGGVSVFPERPVSASSLFCLLEQLDMFIHDLCPDIRVNSFPVTDIEYPEHQGLRAYETLDLLSG